jgi:hypothetical protein
VNQKLLLPTGEEKPLTQLAARNFQKAINTALLKVNVNSMRNNL